MRIPLFHYVFVFFLYCQLSYTQTPDSLAFKSIKQLHELIAKSDNSNTANIITLTNQLYQTAIKEKDFENAARAYIIQSVHFLDIGQNKNALHAIDQAIEISQKYDLDPLLLAATNLKGNHYFDIEAYDMATQQYYKAQKLAQDLNSKGYQIAIKANLGLVMSRTGDLDTALKELHESLALMGTPKNGSSQNQALTHTRISEIFIKKNELDSALFHNTIGHTLAKNDSVTNIVIDALMHRGIIFLNKKELVTALEHLEEAKKISHETNDFVFIHKISNLIAECKYEQGLYQESIRLLTDSLSNLEKSDYNSDELSRCYKLLGKAYNKIGNHEQSNIYYEKHILSLSVLNNKNAKANHEISDKSKTNYENAIQSLEKQKKKQKNSLTFLTISLTILGVALIIFLIILIRSKKKNQAKFKNLLQRIESYEQKMEASRLEKKNTPTLISVIDTKDSTLSTVTTPEVEINQNTFDHIIEGLKKLEEQEFYLKKECNLYNVAKKIKTNTSYLSKTINSHFQKNFNTYINDLRINYAIVRLKNDAKFRSYSIKSIAHELGYKSADSFSKYFKIHTGLLPSFYIKQFKS